MNTPSLLLTPAQLAIPPDLHGCRPLCRCGAVPTFPQVGMHGDGLTHRVVPWPVVEDGLLSVTWAMAVGRRYWCPVCRTTRRIAHLGLRDGARYGTALILALLHLVAGVPLGLGQADADVHELVHGRPLPVSELARTGTPRWSSLRRWLADLAQIWPSVPLPPGDLRTRLVALLAAFGLGAPLHEVLVAATLAHARGGLAM